MEREFHIDDIDEGISLGNPIHMDASNRRTAMFDSDKNSREISTSSKSVKLILDGSIGSVLDKTKVLEIPNYDMLIKSIDMDLGIRSPKNEDRAYISDFDEDLVVESSSTGKYTDDIESKESYQINEGNFGDEDNNEEEIEDIYGNRITIQYRPDSSGEDVDIISRNKEMENRVYYSSFDEDTQVEDFDGILKDNDEDIEIGMDVHRDILDDEKSTQKEDLKSKDNGGKSRPKIIFEGSTSASERPSIDDIPQFFDSNDEFKNIKFTNDDPSDGGSSNHFGGGDSDGDFEENYSRNKKQKESFFEVLKGVFINMLKEKPYTVINTILGMVVGTLVLTIGWQKTLVFVLVVLVFNVFGQIMDRNERVLSIIEIIRGLIKRGN